VAFSGISGCSLVKLISHISLVSFIGFNGWLACARKKMWWLIASFNNSNHNDVLKYHLTTAILAAAAERIPPQHMQAAHGVAKMSSTTKISNAAIHFFLQILRSFVCEGEVVVQCAFAYCCTQLCLQKHIPNATQLFFDRNPQMTKYFIMRECENIHSWISLSDDLLFSHQQGIYGFNFPNRFLDIFSRDLTLLSILII
jgi:hypothetical protein